MGGWSKLLLAAMGALVLAASAYAALQGGTPRSAALSGANVVGASFDRDGSGTAQLRVNVGKRSVCGWFTVSGLDSVTAVLVREGGPGVTGAVVLVFAYPGPHGGFTDGVWYGCGAAPDGKRPVKALVKALVQSPGNFYVDMLTAPYPAGAIRGQLTKPGKGAPKPGKPVKPAKPAKPTPGAAKKTS
jgi:hypothetical protein